MSAASIDILSFVALTQRLSAVRRGEEHLKRQLPVASPHNAILRLLDIVAYTHIPYPWLRRQFPDMHRFEFPDAPRPKPRGKDKPADQHEIEERQRELSRFFFAWDQGTLVKARVGDEWRIVNRHSHALPLGTAPRPVADGGKLITMRIDRATLGLKLT